VSAIVVFPVLGPIFADRVGTGTGLYVSGALFDAPMFADLKGPASTLRTFVGVHLSDGADRTAATARLEGVLGALDSAAPPGSTFVDPIRPPEIVDARSTRTVPTTVGIVFAVLGAVGLLFASWASTRSRSRELAVLQTLGFTRRQVRQTVWTQSVATALGALAIGAPLGAIAGRALWRTFADQLGVASNPAAPVGAIAGAVVAGLCLAFLAAQVPAQLATRTRVAAGLRAQ
jgi:ABC-type antimicrobial peptide transport system permease subunit